MSTDRTEEILICPHCSGTGAITKYSTVWDNPDDDPPRTICSTCKGSGRRLRTVTTTITIEPYDNPEVAALTFEKLRT